MQRVFLFLVTNLAVMVVFSFLLSMFGVNPRSYAGMLIFALLVGMGGAFVSLAMSKWMALRSTGARVIEQPRNQTERWLLETVTRQAQAAGIGTPDVAIYDAPEINAFATGAKRNDALVAVSSGLLHNMSAEEAEAVLAHEVSHVANGDMVTMALIQGVVNTFVMFAARVVAGVISSAMSNRNDGSSDGLGHFAYMAVVMVLEIVFGILASAIVMWFSRQREYRADAGAARLEGSNKMIAALQRLQAQHEPSNLPSEMAAFGIKGKSILGGLFMTHPSLDDRIAALRQASF